VTTTTLKTVPVAPGRLPLIGHAAALWRDPLGFPRSLAKVGDIVRVDLGRMQVYFLTTPELVHEILVTQGRHVDKGRIFDRLRPLFGNGLITSAEAYHRRQRRLIQPLFDHASIASYVEVMCKHAIAMAKSWAPGRTIAIDTAMYELTMTTVGEIMFSAEMAQPAIAEAQRSLPALSKDTIRRAFVPELFDKLPLPIHRGFGTAPERLHRVLDQLIQDYHASRDDHHDLLALVLSARDPETGETMTDQQARDELLTILVAGTEPTAVTLAWAFHELGRHPEVQEKLRDELESVLEGGPVTHSNMRHLAYTNQVLSEVTRMHPALAVMRRPTVPLELGGVSIPAGTELAFSPRALHRDSRYFDDPDTFDPDRWLPERAQQVPRTAFIPFSDGSRRCIGENFGWVEMVVALASIITRWRLRPSPGHAVREVAAGIPRVDALPMIVEPSSRPIRAQGPAMAAS
jgi:cytochrome P450